MNIGGIQKALLELLKEAAKQEKLAVSVFCVHKTGVFLKQIPEEITVLEENRWAKISELPLKDCKGLGIRFFLSRGLASAWSKVFHKGLPAKLLCRLVGSLGEYDIAISYAQPIHDKHFCNLTNEIVLNCCEAKRKVTFVHCDFEKYGGNTAYNRKLYRQFDAVAAVSNSVGAVFGRCVPDMKNKVFTVYNVCDAEQVRRLAAVDTVEYTKKTVVTVARLSGEKGLSRCLRVFARLQAQGLSFAWHIVGGGPLEAQLRQEISELGLEKTVILEGMKENPYRFMKHADYLLLPSFHEAAPMVFDEAIALGLPILSTDTLSAGELVAQRNVGWVCENSEEGLYVLLRRALAAQEKPQITAILDNEVRMAQFLAVCGLEEQQK